MGSKLKSLVIRIPITFEALGRRNCACEWHFESCLLLWNMRLSQSLRGSFSHPIAKLNADLSRVWALIFQFHTKSLAPLRWHARGVLQIVLPTWWHVRAEAKEFVKSLMERCLALTTTPPNYHVSDQTNWVVHVLACSHNETPFWTKGIKTNATCSIKYKFCRCSPKLLCRSWRIGEIMATCCIFEIPS